MRTALLIGQSMSSVKDPSARLHAGSAVVKPPGRPHRAHGIFHVGEVECRSRSPERNSMETTTSITAEAAALKHFLDAQRASAMAIVDGLTDAQLRTAVLPSGWTPLGLIKHLGYAERHWFQRVAAGTVAEVPWPDDDEGQLTSAHPATEVFDFYREQCERSNAVLATTSLDATPVGRHGGGLDEEITDLRRIVLHMIEETARHLGHLDAARELLDGQTGLGPR
jgi:Protein of unknown function (DUF664)